MLALTFMAPTDAEVLVIKRPVFVRYTPGHILARLSWDVLDAVLQKEKSYAHVNTFLRLLLSTPFGFSKRGEWWLRLVINLKHLRNLVRYPPSISRVLAARKNFFFTNNCSSRLGSRPNYG